MVRKTPLAASQPNCRNGFHAFAVRNVKRIGVCGSILAWLK